jgi:nucleoside-diphosphate-sugar epimerase
VHAVVRPGSAAAGLAGTPHTHDGTTEGMLAIVQASRPDVVFHLASLFIAEHRADQVAQLVASNLLLGLQLAEGMGAAGRTLLVNTGTAWQHYENEDYDPVNLYAATKEAYLDLLRFYQEAAGLEVITLELYESYGPRDPRPKLMTALVRAARQATGEGGAGARLALTDGTQRLDLVHVRDIARAYARAAERLLRGEVAGSERWAVRSGEPRSVREVVELVGRTAGKPFAAEWGVRPYRAREVMEPPERPTLPGWRAEIPLEAGIRELLSVGRAGP